MLFWAILGLAQAAPATLSPSSKWQVDHSEAICFVAREFGAGPAKVALAFRLIPILKSYEVMLIGDASSDWRPGELIITSTSSGVRIKQALTLSRVEGGRPVLTASLDENELASIARASELTIAYPGGGALSANAVDKAFSAAKTCQNELVRSWGIDPANASLKPNAIDPGNWITDADYPKSALRARAQGVVAFRVTVDMEGKVASCGILKSSGTRELDDIVCTRIKERGRFKPAIAADGTPVASVMASRYKWSIPCLGGSDSLNGPC